MKLRMQVGCLAMVCASLTACDTKYSAQFKADLTLQRKIAQIAGQANGAAPAVVDPNTRLDGAKAGPGLRLTVMYTLVNAESNGVNSATFEALLAPTIKENSCANPDLRPLIDQGVVVVLEYRGKQGDPIGTVNVNRGTCGTPSARRTATGSVNTLTAFERRELKSEWPYMDPSPIASTPVFVRRGNDCSRISGLMLTSINRGRATMGYSRASSPLLLRA